MSELEDHAHNYGENYDWEQSKPFFSVFCDIAKTFRTEHLKEMSKANNYNLSLWNFLCILSDSWALLRKKT